MTTEETAEAKVEGTAAAATDVAVAASEEKSGDATTAEESSEAKSGEPAEQEQSSEERIRGGGKVTGDRGRNNRRHQPYGGRNNNAGSSGGSNSEGNKNCRVYVGNLAWEVSWQDLKDHMKTTGHDVARANIMTTPDGRSKGCGIVEFATPEGAQQAVLTLNDTELKGRQIFVREDREDRNTGGQRFNSYSPASNPHGHRFSAGEQAQTRRVYVGNLSWDVAWQDLKDHMRQAGEVSHAEVICESNGRSKGCGIVEFATPEEAQKAISTLTDTELKGRQIFVREDREASSSSSAGGFHNQRSNNCSVYIWNLSYETSWQDLKDHCRKAGNVDQATILTDPQGSSIGCAVVVYQRPQDAARAIRELQNSELNGRSMYLREDRNQGGGGGGGGGRGHHGGGHHGGPHSPHGGRGGDHHGGRGEHHGGRGGVHQGGRGGGSGGSGGGGQGCQLFVGNLSYETTWRELKDHFRQCGDVERAEVMTNAEGRSKGFGTVRFFKDKDAESAIKRLNGEELQGRALEVRLDSKAR